MKITRIEVPDDSARYGRRMGRGPLHLVQGRLAGQLEQSGHEVLLVEVGTIRPEGTDQAMRPALEGIGTGVAVRSWFATSTLATALLLCSLVVGAQDEAVTVSNGTHETQVVRVAMTDSLHGGMVQSPSADEAFLLVYLDTADPCFDPGRNRDCFDGSRDELETVAWACGEVELAPDDIRSADGGGLLDGELACSYVIPRANRGLTLRLRDYEPIDLEPRSDSQ